MSIWSAPTVDPDKKLLYASTGDNFSGPVTENIDALVAKLARSSQQFGSLASMHAGAGKDITSAISVLRHPGQENNIKEGVNTTQSVGNFAGGDAPDFNFMEEVQLVALNATAETANPGVTMIMIVKSGGNQFHGRYEATGESSALQSTNLTRTLRAEGVTTGNSINSYENVSADLGGPLKKDKLWFYGAYNLQLSSVNAINFINAATGKNQPIPGHEQNMTGKGTYQLSPNYKLVGYYSMNTEFFYPFPTSANQFHPFQNTTAFHWNRNQMKAELQGTSAPRLVFDILIGRQAYFVDYTANAPPAPEMYNLTTGLYSGPAFPSTRPRRSIGPSGTITYFPPAHSSERMRSRPVAITFGR